ncbi:MAG: cation transporter [Deltaproteobacteria bacterium]|nr:cation transporter [Deltaproteobacteria bacterium]
MGKKLKNETLDSKPEINGDAREIKLITWLGLITNLMLSGFKFLVGTLGCSQAVIADAFHSISDVSTDLAVLFGVDYWSAPPDKNHPYGHRKIEAVITVVIGVILTGAAIGIGYRALATIREYHLRQTAWIAVTGPLISIILKEIIYQFTIKVGGRVKSSALIANAWHHRSDALSSVPALIAVSVSTWIPEWAFIDHLGAMIVSLFILKVAWDIIKPSLSELVDCGATLKEHGQIRQISLDEEGVKGVHAIRTRKYGSYLFVDLHILVDADMSVREGHQISENVKHALVERGPAVLDVVVHLEPEE